MGNWAQYYIPATAAIGTAMYGIDTGIIATTIGHQSFNDHMFPPDGEDAALIGKPHLPGISTEPTTKLTSKCLLNRCRRLRLQRRPGCWDPVLRLDRRQVQPKIHTYNRKRHRHSGHPAVRDRHKCRHVHHRKTTHRMVIWNDLACLCYLHGRGLKAQEPRHSRRLPRDGHGNGLLPGQLDRVQRHLLRG